jgi:hypothetical protein
MIDRHASYWLVCELHRAGVPDGDRDRLAAAFDYVCDMDVIRDPRTLAGLVLERRADLLTLPGDQLSEGLAWLVLRGNIDRWARPFAAEANRAQYATSGG